MWRFRIGTFRTTPRLILRDYVESDFEAYYRLKSDSSVMSSSGCVDRHDVSGARSSKADSAPRRMSPVPVFLIAILFQIEPQTHLCIGLSFRRIFLLPGQDEAVAAAKAHCYLG